MTLDTIDAITQFLQKRDGTGAHAFWISKGQRLRARLVGAKGYLPEGVFAYEAATLEELLQYLC